jgi:hypothetical protein
VSSLTVRLESSSNSLEHQSPENALSDILTRLEFSGSIGPSLVRPQIPRAFAELGTLRKLRKFWQTRRALSTTFYYITTIMEAPYTIASLPKPLDAENGSIYAAPVSSYRGLKKRKRHEVIVGVDGESLNIYNVRLRKTSAKGRILINSRSSHSLS